MKTVPIHDLKKRLSALIEEAGRGEEILVTKHRRPVVRLSSAAHEHLHVGARFGAGALTAAAENATRGRYLVVLADDRRGGRER